MNLLKRAIVFLPIFVTFALVLVASLIGQLCWVISGNKYVFSETTGKLLDMCEALVKWAER